MKYLFHAAYKGSKFRGWQRQPNVYSVQEVLEEKMSSLLKTRIIIHGCGRTDAEVHASQYFFHIEVNEPIREDFLNMINRIIPTSISIYSYKEVDDKFNARFSAIERSYDYLIHTKKNPYLESLSSFYPSENLDLELMNSAAQLILKYTDFRHYCLTPDKHNTTICHVKSVAIYLSRGGDQIRFRITANRYLKGMIRLLMFKLLEVGYSRLSIDDFEAFLAMTKIPEFKRKAFPQGLYLSEVKYENENFEVQNHPILRFDDLSFWKKI